jgi:hypothetical protein
LLNAVYRLEYSTEHLKIPRARMRAAIEESHTPALGSARLTALFTRRKIFFPKVVSNLPLFLSLARTAVVGKLGRMEKSNRSAPPHGLCSSDVQMLPGEQESDFEQIERGWREEYQPEGHAEITLVNEIIQNEWALKRARRRLMHAEEAAVQEWNNDTERHLKLMQRMKVAAERSFYQSWKAMQSLRKDRIQMAEKLDKVLTRKNQLERENEELKKRLPQPEVGPLGDITRKNPFGAVEEKTKAQKLFQGQLHPKKQRKIPVLEQWIEVTLEDGNTVTRLFPSNELLIKRGQKMLPPPELVYRRLNFPNGVPEEYTWTTHDPMTRERGGMGIQRMDVDTWLEVIEREKALGTGHVGPTGAGNLPRPMARGGCDCEVCSGNREILEAAGVSW